ncbi:AGE family epimerase/isomerase [Planctomicrobium sp. SH664]|uniref:AGE family epimerase/isomerase n=1 Tax=Planctomicrobium sp. SH664 TaxID=3448125 RepID=UPI003F5C819B
MQDLSLLTAEGRGKLAETYRRLLLEDCVPFWFPRCVDKTHGGYLHCVDRDGSLVDTDKSVWAQGRMSWMLLTLFNTVEQNADWLAWGKSGLEFLERSGFDQDGRMFFHLTADGRPIRKRRYAYSESFAAIAFAAGCKATGNESWRRRAMELFGQFLDWNHTPGKQPPKFTDVRPLTGLGSRMIALVTAQELRDNLGDHPLLAEQIERAIQEIRELFVKPDLEVVLESVSPTGEIVDHFDGRLLNPGHAIEAAWFILREGDVQSRPELIELGCQMLDWMWKRGWDDEFGGLFYFRDLHDKPVTEYWHDMKFWWPHDEALIATLYAYCLTGEPRYAQWHQQVHDWSFRHFADPEFGEWFGYLHRDGRRSVTLKGNLWKSFFHHPRALWLCWQLLKKQTTSSHDSGCRTSFLP